MKGLFVYTLTKICFICIAIEGSIPSKPDKGCPEGSKPSKDNEKHCCCNDLAGCCWHKCPLKGTDENVDKMEKCGIQGGIDKWSYARLASNDNEKAFVAQGGEKY